MTVSNDSILKSTSHSELLIFLCFHLLLSFTASPQSRNHTSLFITPLLTPLRSALSNLLLLLHPGALPFFFLMNLKQQDTWDSYWLCHQAISLLCCLFYSRPPPLLASWELWLKSLNPQCAKFRKCLSMGRVQEYRAANPVDSNRLSSGWFPPHGASR